MKFDIEEWAKWAEKEQLHNSGINFALSYPEIFKKEGHIQKVNARSFTMFVNAISGLEDWENPKNLSLILQIAQGCFSSDDINTVGTLFTLFINNKLDKLISPKDMLFKEWDYVKNHLKKVVYTDNNYRADIASTLSIRFLNYVMLYFSEKGSKSDVVTNRILDLINHDEMLLSEDMIFNLIKQLSTTYPTRINKLLMNPKVIKKLI